MAKTPLNSDDGEFEFSPGNAVRPPLPETGQEEAAAESFSEPETDAAEEVTATPETQGLGAADDRLLAIKQRIEAQLMERAQTAGVLAMDAHEGAGNIVGVAIGTPEAHVGASGEPGAAGITLFVVHDIGHEEAKSVVVDSMGIRAASNDDVPVHVVETGIIDAQPFRSKYVLHLAETQSGIIE